MSRFQQPVAEGQRVIENRIVGEVPHRKVVDPVQRARAPYPVRVDETGQIVVTV